MNEETEEIMSNYTEIDTEEIKSRIDLFNLIGSHVRLTRNAAKDFHGQCPKCGSAHGLHVYERDGKQLFRCYGCSVMGDAIAYVMWIDDLDFIEACKAIDENLEAILELKPEKPIVQHSDSGDQANKWNQEKSEKILKLAQSNLYGDDARGRNYLLSRGLNPETWATFGLGYKAAVYLPGTWNSETKTASYPAQPAIAIPWYRGGVLKAIRYRFIDKHTFVTLDGYESKEKVKVKSERGSSFRYLYGSHSLSGDDKANRTLIATEGEINAMSIWQVAHKTGIDVLSIGSETTEALTPSAIEAISAWGKVIGFVDKESTAVEFADHLPSAIVISSEKGENGGKYDANDMLVAGELAGFIAAVRYNACRDDDDKRLLLRQLSDFGDYDALVAEIVQVIANDLGVPDPVTLDAHTSDDSTISQQLEQDDPLVRDVVDQAEQVVESIESLVDALWAAYKHGATFFFNNGQLSIRGDIPVHLTEYLNDQMGRNNSHVIATLHRMEYWRNRIAGKVFYATDNNEKAEANYYAQIMGVSLSWQRVPLSEAVL